MAAAPGARAGAPAAGDGTTGAAAAAAAAATKSGGAVRITERLGSEATEQDVTDALPPLPSAAPSVGAPPAAAPGAPASRVTSDGAIAAPPISSSSIAPHLFSSSAGKGSAPASPGDGLRAASGSPGTNGRMAMSSMSGGGGGGGGGGSGVISAPLSLSAGASVGRASAALAATFRAAVSGMAGVSAGSSGGGGGSGIGTGGGGGGDVEAPSESLLVECPLEAGGLKRKSSLTHDDLQGQLTVPPAPVTAHPTVPTRVSSAGGAHTAVVPRAAGATPPLAPHHHAVSAGGR